MLRRSVLVAVVAFTAVLFSTVTPVGAAVRPFGPPQTVAGGCSTASFSADSVVTSSGALVGYATCPSPSGVPIRFFSRNPDGTVNRSQATGFFGRVMAVTYDTTATYVLYFNDSQIRIGKRTNTGVFSSRPVDTWPASFVPSGDIIARDGRWFGVWSKHVRLGDEFTQTELYSSGTGLGITQVTTTADLIYDVNPTLAYSGTTPVVIWSRQRFSELPGQPSDLIVKRYIGGTWQGERVFASLGTANRMPDMHIAAGRTFVTWYRDGSIVVASNATGSFTSHRFNTGGFRPSVATSTTSGVIDHVFVTWTTSGRVFFAESASTGSVQGTWNGTTIASTAFAIGVGGFATKAIVTYGTATTVAARAQT
jgi:hypothetical protein